MDEWLQKEIKASAQHLRRDIKMTPAEYCQEHQGDYEVIKGYESAFMLGGIQVEVMDLLFWLKEAKLIEPA